MSEDRKSCFHEEEEAAGGGGGGKEDDLERKEQSQPSDDGDFINARKEDLEGKAKRKEDVEGKDRKRRRRIERAAAAAGEEDLQRKVPSDGKRKEDLKGKAKRKEDVEEDRRIDEHELLQFDGKIKELSDAEKELEHQRDMENLEYIRKIFLDTLSEKTKKRLAEIADGTGYYDSDFDIEAQLSSDSWR